MWKRIVSLFLLTIGGCTEEVMTAPEPDVETGSPGFRMEIAPLGVPGIGNVCYDFEVAVKNGAPIWSVGLPGTSAPADPNTACSSEFGLPDGTMVYAGICDPGAVHVITLWIDSVWGSGVNMQTGSPLTDWVNPCPAPGGCKIEANCVGDTYTNVTFDLAVMRKSEDGFFGIGVTFSELFCSARLDCSYDAYGNEPIELLHNPATGTREQTALLGFACIAEGGSEAELLASDLRLTCQGDSWSGTTLRHQAFFCIDDGNREILGQATSIDIEYDEDDFDTKLYSMVGARWIFDAASGKFVWNAFAPVDTQGVNWDGGIPRFPLGAIGPGGEFGLVGGLIDLDRNRIVSKFMDPMASVEPAFVRISPTVYLRTIGTPGSPGSPRAWQPVEDLGLPTRGSDPISVIPVSVDPVTRSILAQGAFAGDTDKLWLYSRAGAGSSELYLPPREIVTPPNSVCSYDLQMRHGLLVGSCESDSGEKTAVAIRLALIPSGDTVITPTVLPLGSSSTKLGYDRAISNPTFSYETRPMIISSTVLVLPVSSGAGHKGIGGAFWDAESGSWSFNMLFGGSAGTEAWIDPSACSHEACEPWGANGLNGLFWFYQVTNSFYRRGMAAFDSEGTPVFWTDTDFGNTLPVTPDAGALPKASWETEGRHVVLVPDIQPIDGNAKLWVLDPTNNSFAALKDSNNVPYHLDIGTGSEAVLLGRSDSVGPPAVHHYLYLRSQSYLTKIVIEATQTTVSFVGMSSTGLGTGYESEQSGWNISSEVSTSLRADDDVLNPHPCDLLALHQNYKHNFNAPANTDVSTLEVQRVVALDPATIGGIPRGQLLPKLSTHAPTSPLMTEVVRDVSPAFCINEAGSVVTGSRNGYQAIFGRSGTTLNNFALGTSTWKKNGGAWARSGTTVSPATVSPPKSEGYFVDIIAGAWPDPSAGTLKALGGYFVMDPAEIHGAQVFEGLTARPMAFNRQNGEWVPATATNLQVPSGTNFVIPVDLEPQTQTAVALSIGKFQNDLIFYKRINATSNLEYSPPILFPNPHRSQCQPGDSGSGLLVVPCAREDSPPMAFIINLVGLPGSVVGRAELVWPAIANHVVKEIRTNVIVNSQLVAFDILYESTVAPYAQVTKIILAEPSTVNAGWTTRFHGSNSPTTQEELWSLNSENGFYAGRITTSGGSGSTSTNFIARSATTVWTGLLVSPEPLHTRPIDRPVIAWTVAGVHWALVNSQTQDSPSSPMVNKLELVKLPTGSANATIEASLAYQLSGMLDPQALRAGSSSNTFEALVQGNVNRDSAFVSITLAPTPSLVMTPLPSSVDAMFGQDPAQNTSLEDDIFNPTRCDAWVAEVNDQNSYQGRVWSADGQGSFTNETLPDELDALGSPLRSFSFAPAEVNDVSILNPTNGPGNAWTTDPRPGDALWQFATYRNTESYLCSAGACTNRYWNIAVGFDPTRMNCSIQFRATGSKPGLFNQGIKQTAGMWPVVNFNVQLTGTQPDNNVVCRQNPMDGADSGVQTTFEEPASTDFCHWYGASGVGSRPGCATQFN